MSIYVNVRMPSYKALLIPDPGFTFGDIDLAQADAQIVAWDSGAEKLKALFKAKADIHTENAKVLFGACDGKLDPRRQIAKPFVHGTNYLGTARELAKRIGLTVHQVEEGQKRWFGEHPEILEWHKRVINDVQTKRRVENAFGFGRYFLGRVDQKSTWNEAVAWIPQSTVGHIINIAGARIDETFSEADVAVLMQVHDSLDIQIRTSKLDELIPRIKECTLVTVPYADPLIIPTGLKLSEKSWADCKEIKW